MVILLEEAQDECSAIQGHSVRGHLVVDSHFKKLSVIRGHWLREKTVICCHSVTVNFWSACYLVIMRDLWLEPYYNS